MRTVDIIIKKREGGILSDEEINYFIQGYTAGTIPDYQASALAMAIFFRGMNSEETLALTTAMTSSGKQLDFSGITPIVADKHSTGGVGDKTTLVVAPLVAAVGVPFAKMSGRGLGYFGGTIDKLESIPGFKAYLSDKDFKNSLAKVGLVISGQSAELAPADGKLYTLRDVSGTVESIPLIAASVMSKKLAAGTSCIVLDVKYGSGSFMQTLDRATLLAETMLDIGRNSGRKMKAALSSMDQPLGNAIGNTLEVKEAIATLQGCGPDDLLELAFTLSSLLLVMSGKAQNITDARAHLKKAIDSGTAFAKFEEFVANQGGDIRALENPALLGEAPVQLEWKAPADGFLTAVNAEALGMAAYALGAGRLVKTDEVNPLVGLVLHKKIGDRVTKGETLVKIHMQTADQLENISKYLDIAFEIAETPIVQARLIGKII